MKTFAVVFALCIAGAFGALTDEQRAKLKVDKDACIAESGVEMTKVDNAYKEGIWDETDKKLQCFSSCFLTKLEIMDKDGKLNEEVARMKIAKDIPAEEVEGVMMKCKDMKGTDKCETGMKLMKCFGDQIRTITLKSWEKIFPAKKNDSPI